LRSGKIALLLPLGEGRDEGSPATANRQIDQHNRSGRPFFFAIAAITLDRNTARMRLNKNIGMILLAVYLIFDALLGFGLNVGPFVFLLYPIALAAGIFILIGK
jgi:hypothetical protein